MDKDELVLRYQEGEFSAQEQLEFEQALSSDSELHDVFQFHKQLRNDAQFAASLKTLHDLHQQKVDAGFFEAIERQSAETPVYTINRYFTSLKNRWAIAAAIAAVMVATWVLIPYLPSEDKLVAKVLLEIPDELLPASPEGTYEGLTGNPDAEALLAEAYAAFVQGSYEQAIPLLSVYLTTHQNDYEAKFVLAMAYLSISENHKALPLLEELASKKLLSSRNEVLLKLGALYIHERDFNKAAPLLKEVTLYGDKRQKTLANRLVNIR